MLTKNEILAGGRPFPAKLKDDQTLSLFIKILPVRKMEDYLMAQADEARMIELTCEHQGKPVKADIVDNLHPECVPLLIAEIEAVNADFFHPWAIRQKARAAKLTGLTAQQSPSPTSLPSAP